MAVAVSEVAELNSTSNATSYAVSAFTPAGNTILVAIVAAKACVTLTPTMTDSEGTWTRELSDLWNDDSHGMHVFWRKVDGTPVSITPTFDSAGDAASNCGIFIFQVTPDVVASGNPIRQVVINAIANSSSPTADPNVTFSSAPLTANGMVAAIMTNQNSSAHVTTPSGWTETGESGQANFDTGWSGHLRAGGETSTTITATATSSLWVMAAVEVWNDEPPASSDDEASTQRGLARGIARGLAA
jgi:hypothetical protein